MRILRTTRSTRSGKRRRPRKHSVKVDPETNTVWPADAIIVATAASGVAPPSTSSRKRERRKSE